MEGRLKVLRGRGINGTSYGAPEIDAGITVSVSWSGLPAQCQVWRAFDWTKGRALAANEQVVRCFPERSGVSEQAWSRATSGHVHLILSSARCQGKSIREAQMPCKRILAIVDVASPSGPGL